MNKPRKWWIAGLLSLLEPGVGQIYNGQARKGFLILLLPLLSLPALILGLKSDNLLVSMVIMVVATLAYFLYTIADAIITARRHEAEYRLKKYNSIWVYVGVVAFVSVLNTGISTYIENNHVQAYRIPFSSNEPTLLKGDHVLVDRSPTARNPGNGDLIIFEYPENPQKDFVKRVTGMEGDTVEIRNKELFRNGERITEPYVVHKESVILPADIANRDFFGPVNVPDNSYFVLGDNRDNSYDSRFWGFVGKEAVKGTVRSIYWSWDNENHNVRWGRIGLRTE